MPGLRIGDEDPRCGPASLQQFGGENLNLHATKHAALEQNRQHWEAQILARLHRTKAEAADDRLAESKARGHLIIFELCMKLSYDDL